MFSPLSWKLKPYTPGEEPAVDEASPEQLDALSAAFGTAANNAVAVENKRLEDAGLAPVETEVKEVKEGDQDPEKVGSPAPEEKPEGEAAPVGGEGEKTDEEKKAEEEAAAAAEAAKTSEETEKAKKDEEKAAADAAKLAADEKNKGRDADLVLDEKKVEPGLRKPLKKVIESFKSKAVAARDEAETYKKKLAEVETQKAELEKAVKNPPAIPKEVEEEVKTLRQKVRELDITQDPALKTKYDAKIEKIHTTLPLDVLKRHGLGKRQVTQADGTKALVDDPDFNEAAFREAAKNTDKLLEIAGALQADGNFKDAAKVQEMARQVGALSEAKQAEIDEWTKDYDARKTNQTKEQQAQQEKYNADLQSHMEVERLAATEIIAKIFPQIKAPPAPLPTDSPAVKAAKEKAQKDFEALGKSMGEEFGKFNTQGVDRAEAIKRNAKFQTAAISGVAFTKHIMPKLQADIAAKDAKIKQLEADLAKIKKAGSISRAQSTQPEANANKTKAPEPGSADEAMDRALKAAAQGVSGFSQ